MDSSLLWIILYFHTVSCEWVEITPIVNKKKEVKQIVQTTTDNYEVLMKTPSLIEEHSFTTPVNSFVKPPEQGNGSFDSFNAYTKFMDTLETTPFSPMEASPYISWERESEDDLEPPSNHISYEGFLPFLKMIQDKLFKYKSKSRRSKMSLLKHLRDQLLINIKGRITQLWQPLQTSSEARGYKDEDSHMDFPSNEGALMTIGFLTFAVFLIKLVIKLVHALKYKQQYYGMTTTTTASSVVFLKRKKREEINQEAEKILQYIDEF